MLSKSARSGSKFWLCCDFTASYILNADLYAGREANAAAARNIVNKLAQVLEATRDNFFTSVGLAAPKN